MLEKAPRLRAHGLQCRGKLGRGSFSGQGVGQRTQLIGQRGGLRQRLG